MPTYLSGRTLASITLTKLLAGEDVSREKFIAMVLNLPEDDKVSLWFREYPEADTSELERTGAPQWQIEQAKYPYRRWMAENLLVPPGPAS
jgi:hypothetical protein